MGLLESYKSIVGQDYSKQLIRGFNLRYMIRIACGEQDMKINELSVKTNIPLDRLSEGLMLCYSLNEEETASISNVLGITFKKNKLGTYDISYRGVVIKYYSFQPLQNK